MNHSSHDFSVDTKQSRVAILILIWKYYKMVIRQSYIFILPLLLSKGKSMYYFFIIGLAVVSLLVLVMAILSYYRFHFRIENNELLIQKGVFKKTKLNIPFERIQTINFEQNLLLQLMQRHKVEVDTAGSAKREFSFDALNMDVAEQLRKKILDHKKAVKEVSAESDSVYLEKLENSFSRLGQDDFVEEEILSLNSWDLLKIGLTENHIRAGAWLIAVIGYLFSTLNEAGLKVEDRIEDSGIFENVTPGLALFFSVIPTLFLILIVISVVRTYLRHFDLKFKRMENGFKIFSGLLNRKENSAPDNKIQKLVWGDNPLKRIFGINTLWLKQARSTEADRNKSISIPVVAKENIDRVLSYLYEEEMVKEESSFGISHHFFWRNLIYFIVIPAILIGVAGWYFARWWLYPLALFYLLYFAITTYVQYRKASYSFTDFFLKRKKGIYGNMYEVIPWYKVQVVELRQSIYQRRYQLANIVFHTAAGAVTIPYVSLEQGKILSDYALYKAESSEKEWM